MNTNTNTNTNRVCMKNRVRHSVRRLAQAGAAFCLALMSVGVQAQLPYFNGTVSGQLQPGVYGRIDIGNAPPPPLIYAQPMIIQRPAVLVQQQPLYLHVPPGHAKKWSKHCGKYNACGQPVYFVKVRGDDDYDGDSKHSGKGKDKHKNKGNKHDD
jgi:hypothetical protein